MLSPSPIFATFTLCEGWRGIMYLTICAPRERTNLPAYSPQYDQKSLYSLIYSTEFKNFDSKQLRPRADCANAQSARGLCCPHSKKSPFIFLRSMLMWIYAEYSCIEQNCINNIQNNIRWLFILTISFAHGQERPGQLCSCAVSRLRDYDVTKMCEQRTYWSDCAMPRCESKYLRAFKKDSFGVTKICIFSIINFKPVSCWTRIYPAFAIEDKPSGGPLVIVSVMYNPIFPHNTRYDQEVIGPILFVLRFYGPVNPMGSCRARSVYLTTRLLGRLSPLSG